MRVMFTAFVPSHFTMMVPLAWALRAAGHEVVVAGMGDIVAAAQAAGLSTHRIGTDGGFSSHVKPGHMAADGAGEAPPEVPLTAHELAARRPWAQMSRLWPMLVTDLNHLFVDFARGWGADLVVCETDHNGLIAGGVLGVPVVYHRWGPDMLGPLIFEHASVALAEVCGGLGLGGLPVPDLVVDSCPPGLRFSGLPVAESVRFVPFNGVGEVPLWFGERRGPRVVVALGLLGGQTLLPEFVRGVVEGVSAAVAGVGGVEVVLPLGVGAVEGLGVLPRCFRVVEPTPLNLFVGECDLVINHGGAGTALTACAYGIPQLVLPQPHAAPVGCAERVVETGVGLSVPYDTVVEDPSSLVAPIRALLEDPRYRENAAAMAAEMATLPGPDELVPTLEALVRTRG
ncbi:glycosyltransferase/glycosyltransferase [Amycolatopsis xylanica]|uniref:Glycosyltransferase/glycosyltransferase n=1 Tax=Amycolatopsis xylanica TaxID=589385 RepID=A0A1H2VSA7_9PSEU|nr:nucleotide disphospho-sugar-binding domain-containing protein [Amycolatopsis xylanica]SDW71235.1 glycosyltransferase/glycosyltransferase [Amycolatopsis xylanica]